MADVLLSALPFTGHVAPICAIAEVLVDRGHDVRVYTGGAFRDRVERAGAALVPWAIAPDFDENDLEATFPRLVGRKGFRQVIVNVVDCIIGTAAAQASDLQAEWDRRPWRLIIADEVSMGAALFAERTPVPWTTVAVVPLQLLSPVGPPSGLAIVPGRSWIGRARDAVLRGIVPALARPMTRAYDRQRTLAGMAPATFGFERATFSPQAVLASGSPALDFDRPRPDHVHFVGSLASASTAGSEPPKWWPDLEGRRVVHVTQGTQNIDPSDLIRPALEALAGEDVIVVVATGVAGVDSLPFPVPANARIAGFVPYAALLPRVDVMITNGGWGGVVAGLAHGIPLVVAGGDLDKPDIAVRVAWSGAGVNLRTGTPTAAEVGTGYRRITDDPAFRMQAERIGVQIRASGGADRAADLLETRLR